MTSFVKIMEAANLEKLKGYIYCDMADKVFAFSALNFECRKKAKSMPIPSEEIKNTDIKYRESIQYNTQLFRQLCAKLYAEIASGGYDKTTADSLRKAAVSLDEILMEMGAEQI